jgi:hypothetical protein
VSVAILDSRRLTLIALVPDKAVSIFGRIRELPRFGDAQYIAVHSRTAAERTALAARIDAAVSASDRAVMLLAQGSACAAAAWWARLSPKAYTANVAGALLVAPGGAGSHHGHFAAPKIGLPFPSIVVGADDEAQRLGVEWGSRLIDGPLLNAATAPTSRLRAIIDRFTSAVVNRDVVAAHRIIQAIGDA